MEYLKLKKRIKENEGFVNKPYKDQLGNPTIGYGHLIKRSEICLSKKKLTKGFLSKLFEDDFQLALFDYKRKFKKLSLSKKAEEVLIEMIFQMGIKKVACFKNTIKHLKKKNKYLASLEMMKSRWYLQTPRRVERLIKDYLK